MSKGHLGTLRFHSGRGHSSALLSCCCLQRWQSLQQGRGWGRVDCMPCSTTAMQTNSQPGLLPGQALLMCKYNTLGTGVSAHCRPTPCCGFRGRSQGYVLHTQHKLFTHSSSAETFSFSFLSAPPYVPKSVLLAESRGKQHFSPC